MRQSSPPASRAKPDPPLAVAIGIGAIGIGILLLAWLGSPAHFNAPRSVVALAGVVFLLAGVLAGLRRIRHARPSLYLFVGAVFLTVFALVPAWVWMFSTGPFEMTTTANGTGSSNPVSGFVGRTAFGLAFLVMLPFVVLSWRRWYRAWGGEEVKLDE